MPETSQQKSLLYVGTYAEADAAGIYLYAMHPASGALELRESFQVGANPSFLTFHPNGRILYAVNELRPDGAVSAFAIEPGSAALTFLNRQLSQGGDPCYLTVEHSGRFLLVANYESGSLAVHPLETDGRLQPASQVVQHHGHGIHPKRQLGPHAHSIRMAPDNSHALSCDLGADKVLVYRFDSASGELSPRSEVILAPGTGPRHLDFHPTLACVYVLNELNATITAFDYAAETGTLTGIQTLSTLPEDYTAPNLSAEVAVHPSGRFVYASNRGHDSIAIYTVDEVTGRLTLVGHESTRGRTPRHFVIDPTGTFLLAANQESDTIGVFQIDSQNGGLSYRQQIDTPRPVYLKFWNVGEMKKP